MAANLEQMVDSLSALTVMEAAELSKMLEEKWGRLGGRAGRGRGGWPLVRHPSRRPRSRPSST